MAEDMMKKNIRDMEFSTSSGKDVCDTSVLSGEASEAPSWKARNETKVYETPALKVGKLGGNNTNS